MCVCVCVIHVCVCVCVPVAHLVHQGGVTAAGLQQQACDMHVSMLTGTHEGGGAVPVLAVDVRAAAQQQLHHGNAPVAHRQHQCRLPCLGVRRSK